MPNERYVRGANYERKLKKMYELQDYYVMKSGGSLGAADLILIKKHSQTSFEGIEPEVVLVQAGEINPRKMDRLFKLAASCGVEARFHQIPPKRGSKKHQLEKKRHMEMKKWKVGLKNINQTPDQ